MNVHVLASSSKANAAIVEAGDTRILLDCGLSARETFKRMVARGLDPEGLTCVLLTHAHGDHTDGLRGILNKLPLPVYLTNGTLGQLDWEKISQPKLLTFDPGKRFKIGNIAIQSVPVLHDAEQPTAFTFTADGVRLAWATDLGAITPIIQQEFSGADIIGMEFSYDPDMLAECGYPPRVKRRIAGEYGHLSNEAACSFVSNGLPGTSKLLALHLSANANNRELVEAQARIALGESKIQFEIAGGAGS